MQRDLQVLPLKGAVVFPHAVVPLTVGRPSSIAALSTLGPGDLVFFATEKDGEADPPTFDDLYPVGTVGRVVHAGRLTHQSAVFFVVVQGVQRARLLEGLQHEPFLRARVVLLEETGLPAEDPSGEALLQTVRDLFVEVVLNSPTLANELAESAHAVTDASVLTDLIAATLPSLKTADRLRYLEMLDVRARLESLSEALVRERENQRVEDKIRTEVQKKVGETQREYYLREQLKAIQNELGVQDEVARSVAELRGKLEQRQLSEEARAEANRELARLEQMSPASAEYSVSRTWLETVAALPWGVYGAQAVDLARAEQVLDEDHFDLERVKQRILEHLAVLKLKPDLKGPLLCFVGPPGVGKTSLGRSIARALGRSFVRISLGGMRDEAEIRGHRRTYVGALPGQILAGMRRAATADPVFMLDEIDKLGADFRGDPASALLEVLDPEQNASYRDHYLDVVFDLSRVLFITTANILDPVPRALLDRMEVLELPGYAEEEKVEIARRHLVPRQVREHGLSAGEHIEFTEDGLREIIRSYTAEAGVRNLERAIASLCRKHARLVAAGRPEHLSVTHEVVREKLGAPRFQLETELQQRCQRPGVSVALAWTPTGGELLFIEATRMPRDRGEFTITGQLGQVMQESTRAALSWLRANALTYGIDPQEFKRHDVHLHVPAGGIAKDGPSAGLAMAAALFSLFTQQPVRPAVAATGEITLSGFVLPVGGLKEKVLAARRSGVREIVLPRKNEPNVLDEIPAHLREGLQLHFVSTVEEALPFLFVDVGSRLAPLRAVSDLPAASH